MASETVTDTAKSPPTRFAAALFPGFQALDLFGPLDTLNLLSGPDLPLSLYVLSSTLDPVSTLTPEPYVSPLSPPSSTTTTTVADTSPPKRPAFPMSQSIQPTHTYDTCPDDVEVLIVPGGRGCHDQAAVRHIADFIRRRYPRLRFLLTICTGSGLAAQAGVLSGGGGGSGGGRKATTNKRAIDWIIPRYPDVQWQKSARWVVDGNIYTASGISAGMDMIYAFVADQYGPETAERIARQSEYTRSTDPADDPFARDSGVRYRYS